MTAFTNADRRAGQKAMEEVLTPIQRAYRKFLSGRPPATPKNTPLGAVALATEQRQRLTKILADEGLVRAHIVGMAVVVRFNPPVPETPSDTILVEEGKEGSAIAFLEQYGAKYRRPFVIAGLLFTVKDDQEKRFFVYPIERTPEGEQALLWSAKRQTQRKPHKAAN